MESPRVLLVDDDLLFCTTLRRLAEHAGISLHTVTSVRSMEKIYFGAQFDVLITDYELPNITGIQLVRALEACGRGVPSVLVTSYAGVPGVLPSSILASLHKSEGPQRILCAAVSLYRAPHRINDKKDVKFFR